MIHFKVNTGKGLCGARVVYSSSLTSVIPEVDCPQCRIKILQGRHSGIPTEEKQSEEPIKMEEPIKKEGPFKFLLSKELSEMEDSEKLKYFMRLSEKHRQEIARLRNIILSLGGRI